MIPPAPSSAEWAELDARILALCNDALPDADPRKLTWAMVDGLRKWADTEDTLERLMDAGRTGVDSGLARAIADAIESHLPPR